MNWGERMMWFALGGFTAMVVYRGIRMFLLWDLLYN